MPEIGATLREARMRARIDVSEIEAQTKIRAKYLRALENEEWGLLPGPDVREELPAHLRRRRSVSTARRWWRSTGCSHERPSDAARRADRLQPAAQASRAPARAALRRAPRAATWSLVGVVALRDRAADRGAAHRRRRLRAIRRRTAPPPREPATRPTARHGSGGRELDGARGRRR